MTDWRKVQGSQVEKPKEFDTTTSAVVVYQRKNIERITVEDGMTGETAEFWQYDERELTRDEYYAIMGEMTRENTARLDEVDETSMTGLLAVTDLYEQLIEKGVL